MITKDDVVHAATLSRLKLTDDEVARFTGDLERIVRYVETVMSVNVDALGAPASMEGGKKVSAPAQAADARSPRRADETAAVLGRRTVSSSNGYDVDTGLVSVPKVIE